MIKQNEEAKKVLTLGDSKLKDLIVDYVGEKTNPENDEVTVERVIEVIADEFPEFLLVVAEENWISGYTQALSDVEFVSARRVEDQDDAINDDQSDEK